MILYAEKNDIKISPSSQLQDNIYKKLFYKTPYISRELNEDKIKSFTENYNKYHRDMENIIQSLQYHNKEISTSRDEIVSETYSNTFMIDKNYYIYENYKARLKDKTIISKEYIIAKVSPYSVQYYFIEQ